jgi:uncharacterized membrane protein
MFNTFLKSKNYCLIYLILIILLGASTVTHLNFKHPEFIILVFVIVAILGIFCILFYFNNDKQLHKVAFVIIICFGIVTAFIVPICDISDEIEHLTRAEITSQGAIIPHWTGEDMGVDSLYNHTENERFSSVRNDGAGYNSIASMMFFMKNLSNTFFDTAHDTDKINYTPQIIDSAFEQNPFYGYLPQAIGILIAKLLDLNVIWILWLARICNLICYAAIVSYAIKKAPVLKMPLLAVACIPISIYQAASTSIDSMIFALGILAVSYFIYMYKSEDNSLDIKNVAIFSVICLLLGLCKLPYLAFIFLLFFVPVNNFKFNDKNPYIIILVSIAIVGLIGVLWSRHSVPALAHSWRSSHNLINSTLQIQHFLNHPSAIIKFIFALFTTRLYHIILGLFNFFGASKASHYTDKYYIVIASLASYLALTLLAYPKNIKFDLKTKIGAALIILVVYLGTCFIQLLTFADVGTTSLGLSTRYFIPLFALLPIAVWIKLPFDKNKFDKYAFVLMIVFMATLVLSFLTKYY